MATHWPKGLAFVLLFPLIIALPGCWDNRDPRSRAFITAMGFDLTDDGLMEVTIQIPAPGQLRGSSGGGGGKQNPVKFTTVTGQGENFAEAYAQAQASVSRELYFGQMNLLLFGRSLAMKGLQPLVLELSRTPEAITCFFAMADRVQETLAIPSATEPIPGTFIRSFLESVEVRGRFVPTRMWKLYRGLLTPGRDPYMPVIETAGGMTRIVGTAILKGDRLAAVLTPEETRSLAWLLTGTRREILTVRVGERTYPLRVDARPRVKVRWNGKRPAARASIRLTAEVAAPGSPLNSETLRQVEAALSDRVAAEVRRFAARMTKIGSDPVGFGARLLDADPQRWGNLDWKREYPHLQFDVVVRSHIYGTGMRK